MSISGLELGMSYAYRKPKTLPILKNMTGWEEQMVAGSQSGVSARREDEIYREIMMSTAV
jgi:hypothetical protein